MQKIQSYLAVLSIIFITILVQCVVPWSAHADYLSILYDESEPWMVIIAKDIKCGDISEYVCEMYIDIDKSNDDYLIFSVAEENLEYLDIGEQNVFNKEDTPELKLDIAEHLLTKI